MNDHARSIVLIFDESLTRIQTVSELLLISCTPRPVFLRPDDLDLTDGTYVKYRDKVIGQLNKMMILSRDIASQSHGKQIHWKQFCHRVQELTTVVIYLSELCAHIAYLIAINMPGSEPAVAGPVTNIHQMTQADLDIKFTCTRLKRSKINDLHPPVLVDLCSSITKSLGTITDICRNASEKILDSNDQNQFKLCIKAITSTTGCLVSSIKCFKQNPSDAHLGRVVAFCDPVTSASSALLCFASEEAFVGTPGKLTTDATEIYKSILGLSMSIASANIQICRVVRDLVYSTSLKRNQDRLSLCVESVTRSSSQLRDLLLSHEFIPKMNNDLKQLDYSLSIDNHIVRKSHEGSQLENSKLSPKHKERMLKQSFEKSKEILALGDLHLSDSSLLKSRPSSLSVEVTLADIHSEDQRKLSSPNNISPSSFLSSPLSTSSLSLASTSSFNMDSLYFVEEVSPMCETRMEGEHGAEASCKEYCLTEVKD
ncbi:hypothetical protein Btru_056522 [Bulinus truncatus]|nr:hypothetical protein Btru_056522 [Bulinus truncatus]